MHLSPWLFHTVMPTPDPSASDTTDAATADACATLAIGNMIGPQFFLDSQKPHYTLGVGAMIFSFVMMGICGVLYWYVIPSDFARAKLAHSAEYVEQPLTWGIGERRICMHQNQRRDREGRESRPLLAMGALAIDDLDDEAESLIRDTDKTDFEIPTFRYTY